MEESKRRRLEQELDVWKTKVMSATVLESGEMANTFQMVADVDKIIAEAFECDPVLIEDN